MPTATRNRLLPILGCLLGVTVAPAQAVFEEIPLLQPVGSVLAWDQNQQRVLLCSTDVNYPGLWQLQGNTWTRVLGFPPVSNVFSMSFDRTRNVLLALDYPDLSEWNGTTWTRISPPFNAPWCLTYDAARNATTLLVQHSNNTVDLWTYGVTGFQQLLNGSPFPTVYPRQIMVTGTGEVLCFADRLTPLPTLETWRWNGGAWTQLSSPPVSGVFVQDPTTQQPFLLGYPTGSTNLAMWSWTNGGWNQVFANGPALGEFSAIHTGSRIVVQTNGRIDQDDSGGATWEYRNGQWQMLISAQPKLMVRRCFAYDSARQRTVMVGLIGTSSVTFEWDGQRFELRNSRPANPSSDFQIAYDRLRQRTVLRFGTGETEEWDGSTWTQTVAPFAGPVRFQPGMAFDGQRIVLFGGVAGGPLIPETWFYNGTSWTLATPPNIPAGPFGVVAAKLVFDERRGRTVLFCDSAPFVQTLVYEWDGTTWSGPISVPWIHRRGFFAGFDPARGCIVIGGGLDSNGGGMGDVWEWDGVAFRPTAGLFAVDAVAAEQSDGDMMVHGALGWYGSPRVHHYTSVHRATIDLLGGGCPSSAGVAGLAVRPWERAWLGETFRIQCTRLPAGAAAVAWVAGFSATMSAGYPLPFDLGPIGAPGCMQRISIDTSVVTAASQGLATFAFAIPNTMTLIGTRLHLQCLIPDPAANAIGLVVSDAVRATVGAR
jgi:hypothetical protein